VTLRFSSSAPNASSSSALDSSNGRRKDLVPSHGPFILRITPVVGVDETRSRTMEIVGIVMLTAVALYFVQQFQPGV
jgi:hypothetical protein